MKTRSSTRLFARIALGVACATGATLVLAQAARPVHGDVVAVHDHVLQLKTAGGQESEFALPDDARISLRVPASLSAIAQHAFVGVAAAPRADGTLVASGVQIFPESMRGAGEGHRPMASVPGSTMTNATVSRVSGAPVVKNSMTNATVSKVDARGGGRMLHLTYQGGAQDILVPDNVPVVRVEAGDRTALKAGAHVIVYPTTNASGGLVASRIRVGANGSVPAI
jgi:hypothetical protein